MGKYLGRDSTPKKHELDRVQNGKSIIKSKDLNPDVRYEIEAFDRQAPCKLCQKPFKRFTRKQKCPWCLDIVCKECLRRKTQLPQDNQSKKSRQMKVCDGCFGAINYFVAEMNHTEAEFSATETVTMYAAADPQTPSMSNGPIKGFRGHRPNVSEITATKSTASALSKYEKKKKYK